MASVQEIAEDLGMVHRPLLGCLICTGIDQPGFIMHITEISGAPIDLIPLPEIKRGKIIIESSPDGRNLFAQEYDCEFKND